MKLKRILSLIIICTIVITALFCPMTTIAKTDYSCKIDSTLAKKLEKINDNDMISVSVWFKDIDHEKVKAAAVEKIKGKISSDVLRIVYADVGSNDIVEISKKENQKSIDMQKNDSLDIQKYIEAKREITSKTITDNSKKIIKEIESKLGEQNKFKIRYICKYVPNVEMYLTKKMVFSIVEMQNITDIYYCDPNLKFIEDYVNTEDSRETRYAPAIDTTYFDVTGINQARTVWGLGGNGVKIGVFDTYFMDPNNVDYFYNTSIDYTNVAYSTWTGNDHSHGNMVSSIIAGRRKNNSGQIDYLGAVPAASLYWASYISDGTNYKNKFDALASSGCNIINMCVSMDSSEESNNTYGDTSKWFDHFSIWNEISLVFSSGNLGEGPIPNNQDSGVTVGKMSHNAIVVGNCNNSGTIHNTSSYNTSTTLPYKPDLVAPGTSIDTPAGGPYTGTSCSAPIVTGAVAQLCQISPVLRLFPTLMKAVTLCGTKRTNDMISANLESVSNQSTIVMSRQYGCGILNVINMYESFNIYNRNKYGTVTGDGEVTFSKSITVYGTKQLRAVATWEKTFGTDPTQKDIFAFFVTCPNGTVYKTRYNYDNKALISFPTSSSGTYVFELKRRQTTGQPINYSISVNLCNE